MISARRGENAATVAWETAATWAAASAWRPVRTAAFDEEWTEELVEPGEAQVGLELRAGSPQHERAGTRCLRRYDFQQHRLAHARVARQQQRPALNRGLIDKGAQELEVLVPPDQLR